jgi:hypothetical protein
LTVSAPSFFSETEAELAEAGASTLMGETERLAACASGAHRSRLKRPKKRHRRMMMNL